MTTRITLRGPISSVAVCLLFALAGSSAAQVPIEIRFENSGGDGIAVEPASGWPLTLSLDVDRSQLIGVGHVDAWQKLPTDGVTGFLLFDDPDGCPSWIGLEWQKAILENQPDDPTDEDCPVSEGNPWPRDETLLEITPGIALPDSAECGRRPEILTFDDSQYPGVGANTRRQAIGPCVGSDKDGYGYGPNPRLPQLVVLADAGPGVVTTELSNLPTPREARNLAGLFHSVTWEAKTSRGGTRVVLHMNVPKHLFDPIVLYDQSPGDACDLRVDGEEKCGHAVPIEKTVTVRAFVVNRYAPSILADHDGDDTVDIADAERAGLEPLSNEASFRFRQLPEHENVLPYPFDFNGDGRAALHDAAPAGPGGIVEIPP